MDWNECYINQETPWDKGIPTPVLDEILARQPFAVQGHVLVPGCGLGHDALHLAKLGHQVTAADIAPLALEKARQLDRGNQVQYILADILNPATELEETFDSVWEHTCLCALNPDWRDAYVKGIKTLLKPGGRVAGVFFINPEMDPGENGPPFGITEQDLAHLWQSYGFTVLDSWVPQTGYPGRVGRELAMLLQLDAETD